MDVVQFWLSGVRLQPVPTGNVSYTPSGRTLALGWTGQLRYTDDGSKEEGQVSTWIRMQDYGGHRVATSAEPGSMSLTFQSEGPKVTLFTVR